ncbi:MAG: hypothetical protein KDD66_16990 [Bdellovibrionales bacterium]|nr:hypothetical protein [Bdellovibrionales bacterium]
MPLIIVMVNLRFQGWWGMFGTTSLGAQYGPAYRVVVASTAKMGGRGTTITSIYPRNSVECLPMPQYAGKRAAVRICA